MTSLLPPPNRAYISNLLPRWTGGALLQRMFKRGDSLGDSPGDSPAPNRDPALSAKVTIGGLSAPISRWKVRYHLLWIDGSQPPVHTPLPGINVEEPHSSHYDKKTKRSFSGRQWSSFLCFTFLFWSPVQ
jgi:hypothetical protein